MVLQVELAQHDSMKNTGLETKPVRPEGKKHLKAIKQVTNEFDATTNEVETHPSDVDINSVGSKDSSDRETDTREWKDQDMGNSFRQPSRTQAQIQTDPTSMKRIPPLQSQGRRDPTHLPKIPQDKQEPRKDDCRIPQRIVTTITKKSKISIKPQIVPTKELATRIQNRNLSFLITPAS